jgi:hypothetical protein
VKCYAKHDRPIFTLKTGTIFEDFEKWLPAVWIMVLQEQHQQLRAG